MGKLDELDMKILTELVKDSSISIPKLSKKLNSNPSVTYSRVKRLLNRNVIKRFTIEVNEELLGYNVAAIIGINIDPKKRDEVVKGLLSLPEVREVSEVTGRFDIIAKVKTKSLDALREFVSEKIGRIPGLIKSETFLEMKRTTSSHDYTLDGLE
ncbi:MAG: Lrp/AsnC family transcriptional regulator [Thaumarchaeota archaeon]|nr:Lrp/AsnC family transcriptional regulator [Nitrososphaerota archaeon]